MVALMLENSPGGWSSQAAVARPTLASIKRGFGVACRDWRGSSTPMGEPSGSTCRPNRLRPQTPYPIAALPSELAFGQELLLLCGPEQGGWRLGFWREGAWRDANHPFEQLRPTHFALASGWRQVNGQWLHSGSGWILLLGAFGVALAWMAALAIAPELGRDLWALCTSSALGTESLDQSLGR